MKKVLISFIGTGQYNDENTARREYSEAKYSFDGRLIGESSFVSATLIEHFKIDKLILIGTAKSMWEEVYSFFCDRNHHSIDEPYYWSLANDCEKANHKSDLEQIDFSPIEKVIGENTQVIVIPYGINEKENQLIIKKLIHSFSKLEKGDKITLDVTHGFRSQPLFCAAAINYLIQVNDKELELERVLYGMLEARREFEEIAPIVDLSSIVELQRWSTAAYNFKENGKGDLLSKLMGESTNGLIQKFSDAVAINYVNEIQSQLSNLQSYAGSNFDDPLAEMIVPQVLSKFTKRLQKVQRSKSLFQLELSIWHAENRNYGSSFIVLAEGMISYVCEKESLDAQEKNQRDRAKNIMGKNKKHRELFELYKPIRDCRNNIAHSLSGRKNSIQSDVEMLLKTQKKLKKIFNQNNS